MILHGQPAADIPETPGQKIMIEVGCHEAYQDEVDGFIANFATVTRTFPEWSAAGSPYV